MAENNVSNKFMMNEYIDVNVKQNLVQLCSNCYKELGWYVINTSSGIDSVTIKMQFHLHVQISLLLRIGYIYLRLPLLISP